MDMSAASTTIMRLNEGLKSDEGIVFMLSYSQASVMSIKKIKAVFDTSASLRASSNLLSDTVESANHEAADSSPSLNGLQRDQRR